MIQVFIIFSDEHLAFASIFSYLSYLPGHLSLIALIIQVVLENTAIYFQDFFAKLSTLCSVSCCMFKYHHNQPNVLALNSVHINI